MSVNEEKANLEKKVVVNENEVETTEIVVKEEESKTVKAKKIGKAMLKVAGIAGVGLLGYILGTKCSKNSEDDYETEVIEAEIVEEN